VLTVDQQEISNLFAQRSWDDTVFADVEWDKGLNDVPQLPNVSARFHCRTEHKYAGGDHIIIVGAVLEFETDPQAPLVFFQGEYKS